MTHFQAIVFINSIVHLEKYITLSETMHVTVAFLRCSSISKGTCEDYVISMPKRNQMKTNERTGDATPHTHNLDTKSDWVVNFKLR
jgi:hypothetical protein